jgi:hypothetical protein
MMRFMEAEPRAGNYKGCPHRRPNWAMRGRSQGTGLRPPRGAGSEAAGDSPTGFPTRPYVR